MDMFKNLYIIILFISVFIGLVITFVTLPNFHIIAGNIDSIYPNQKIATSNPFGPSITTYRENDNGPECENTLVFRYNGGWPIADQQEVISCSPTYVETYVWPFILNFFIVTVPIYLILCLVAKFLQR